MVFDGVIVDEGEPNALELTPFACLLSLAAVPFESPCRYHCSKPYAFFSERWFNAGGPCLGLSDPACSTAQSGLTTRMAIIVGSATGSIT